MAQVFQSLSRVADHSATTTTTTGVTIEQVSIPRSGCRSFGRETMVTAPAVMLLFQSLSRVADHSAIGPEAVTPGTKRFQSLSRVADHSALVTVMTGATAVVFQSLSRVADHSAMAPIQVLAF